MHQQDTDESIRQEIQLDLRRMPGAAFENVTVVSESGVVRLSGHVADSTIRRVGEQIAKRVPGVRAVADEIEIRRAVTDAELDVGLVQAVVEAFGRGRQGND